MAGLFDNLPRGAQAELFVRRVRKASVRFANSQFEGTQESVHEVHTLRLIRDGRMSIASTTKPGSDEELLAVALETVKYGNPVRHDMPGPRTFPEIALVSQDTRGTDLRTMIDVSDDLASALLAHDRRIRVMSGVEREEIEVSLSNSNGFAGSYGKTVWDAGLGGQLIQGDDMLFHGESQARVDPGVDYGMLKREVIEIFEQAKNVVSFPAGTYPVIFAPSQVSFLMWPLLACLNGKAFARGISPLKEQMGRQLLDQRVTIVDDGTLPWTVSSAPFDREGVATRRNVLVDAGVPRNLLLDLQTAQELGMEPTGNGTAGGPAVHRVLLAPGDAPLTGLIAGIDRGLIIHGSMGAWAGNPYGGNVSGTISLGLSIEGGKIAGRVKNCMFSVNVFRHLRERLLALSAETKEMSGGGSGQGGATLPYVLLGDVVISSDVKQG